MKVGIKDMKDQIENDGPLASLLGLMMKNSSDETKEGLLDHARDHAATHAIEGIIVTMAKAQRLCGIDEDPMAEVAMVIARLGELCLVNMIARLDDDTPDEALESLYKHLNDLFKVKMRDDKSLRKMFTEVRAQVNDQFGDDA